MHISMQQAQKKLLALGRKAWQGERIIITRTGQPYLEILPFQAEQAPRRPGRWRERIQVAADFDPTTRGVIADFEGA